MVSFEGVIYCFVIIFFTDKMPRIKSELSELQSKVREYNKIVQSVIKEGIVKNRERRLMKIKLKDDDKKTYTFE